MEILVTRSRITGTMPFYEYRALVPADEIPEDRRLLVSTVASPRIVRRFACVRIALLIAPERYFAATAHAQSDLAARIGLVAKRLEMLIVRTLFPEMTADLVPVVFRLDHNPGNAAIWTSIEDLTGAFDRLERGIDILTAFDLGLEPGCGRHAA